MVVLVVDAEIVSRIVAAAGPGGRKKREDPSRDSTGAWVEAEEVEERLGRSDKQERQAQPHRGKVRVARCGVRHDLAVLWSDHLHS